MQKTQVSEFYSKKVSKEWRRLVRDPFHKLEFETTMKFLKKHLPKNGKILDAGGGPGRYTIELAKMGFDVDLLDYTPELLEKAKRQIRKAGVQDKVKNIVEGSITDLFTFADESYDAVICLGGPVSHLKDESQRQKAVLELKRVAKKKAKIFISVMGRLAVVQGSPRYWLEDMVDTTHFKKIWQTGDDHRWGGGYFCHFFMPEELDKLVSDSGLKIVQKVGLEGLGSNLRMEMNRLPKNPIAYENWLEAHYELCTHEAVYATSGHMLIIGQKL